MTALTNQAPKDSFGDLLQVSNSNSGIDGTRRFVSDGKATNSTLKLSNTDAEFASGQVLFADGSTSACAIAFSTQTNTGMFLDAANNGINFAVKGTEVLTLFDTNLIVSRVDLRTDNGPKLTTAAPSNTSPSVQPDKDDADTGLGRNAEDELSAIAGGKEVYRFATDTTAVNTFKATASPTGNALTLEAVGTDTNIGINLTPKGTGTVQIGGNDLAAVVIASGTATTATSLDITDLSQTYRGYLLLLSDIDPSAGDDLLSRMDTNNGASFESGASDYSWMRTHVSVNSMDTTSTVLGGDYEASEIQLAINMSSGSEGGAAIWIIDPMNGGYPTALSAEIVYEGSGGARVRANSGGQRLARQQNNAIQFFFSSTTINMIDYTLIGLRA